MLSIFVYEFLQFIVCIRFLSHLNLELLIFKKILSHVLFTDGPSSPIGIECQIKLTTGITTSKLMTAWWAGLK